MRKILVLAAAACVGTALASCSASQPPASADQSATNSTMAYEPRGSVTRAPLSPPPGYAAPGPPPHAPTQLSPYGGEPYPGAPSGGTAAAPQLEGQPTWRASPRWAAVKGQGCVEVVQDAQGEPVRVEHCSQEELDSRP